MEPLITLWIQSPVLIQKNQWSVTQRSVWKWYRQWNQKFVLLTNQLYKQIMTSSKRKGHQWVNKRTEAEAILRRHTVWELVTQDCDSRTYPSAPCSTTELHKKKMGKERGVRMIFNLYLPLISFQPHVLKYAISLVKLSTTTTTTTKSLCLL